MAVYADIVDLLPGGATVTGAFIYWPGGQGRLTVDGTNFNGCSVSLQVPGITSAGIAADTTVSFSAPGTALFRLEAGPIRIAIGTATPGAPIFAQAKVVRS